MTFNDKISKVMEISKLSIGAIEGKCGISNATLRDAIDENRIPTPKIIEKLISGMRINREWWNTGQGQVFEKGNQQPDKNLSPESIYRDLVEANTEYRLVPKTILDEEYRIVLKSELDSKERLMENMLSAKNSLIDQLHREISDLRSGKAVHSQQA